MNTKELVREAIGLEWVEFERRHPNLARVLDRERISEEAAARLADDPRYQQAMRDADAAGAVAQVVRGFVKEWMAMLLN